ncbi:TlpA family protein disulfide reductase [Maribacter polysiphoniae]|uniref:Thiol-disulfide isomerase/thioredoxin n=1 Tax=Maribacter polysiphoniae TaxID=429344 RepID=A0A316E5M6_9FLAO|nr:TlpA disulfide reductase family protein [Maribacter polysiphoniae]MBD1259103.1 TlpA family protein disulfide reductase [Maribacter polysiphoniae]PWK24659.1 thiol-disulfide isomerase/thioredoxin [Maribacter polysiphoniae]
MRLKKIKWLNIVLIIGIVIVLFTPVGRYARAFAGKWIASGSAMVKGELQMGVDNYNWQLVNIEGKDFNFEEARNKVVLVNFWATWCPPCIAEMPSLQSLYHDYGDKIVFMCVAQDNPDKVAAFISKKGYDLPVYFSKTEAPSLLSAKLLPTTYIIDRQGKIVIAETGSADWNRAEVRTILDGLLQE